MMADDPTEHLPNGNLKLILARLDSLVARMANIENTVDARLKETRPIWERALAEIAETRAEMNEVRTGMNQFRVEMDQFRAETNDHFDTLEHKFDVLAEDVIMVRGGHKRLDARLRKLESEPAQ